MKRAKRGSHKRVAGKHDDSHFNFKTTVGMERSRKGKLVALEGAVQRAEMSRDFQEQHGKVKVIMKDGKFVNETA